MTLKRRWRCGCEPTLENPAFSGNGPCCDVCNNTAPCAWVIQSACRHATASGEFYLDRCTALIKEMGNCEWTSRWAFPCNIGGSNDLGWCESGDPYFDRPMVLAYCSSGKRPACVAGTITPTVDQCDDIPFDGGGLSNCCTWPEFLREIGCDKGFVKWRLTATSSTTATLLCTTRDGGMGLFTCDDWSCTEESTFLLIDRTDELQGIPHALCVAPADREPTLVCEDMDSQCACCDYDFQVGTLYITISACPGFTGYHEVLVERTCEDPGYCGVTWPSPAPCCVFVGTLTATVNGCDKQILLITWCDGSAYQQEVYCYNDNTLCYETQGMSMISLFECRCNGPYIEATFPELDCCCPDDPPLETCLCDDAIPATLTADVQGSEGGGSLCVFSITNTGTIGECPLSGPEINTWTGTATCGGVTYEFAMTIDDDCTSECTVSATISVDGTPNPYQSDSGVCDPFEYTFTFDNFTVVVTA